MGATLKLESEKVVTVGSTLKVFTKLLNWLRGIGWGQEEAYESRTVTVLANGMYNKLHEELEDDGALLFSYIFMAYLDIGGEHRYHSPFDPRVWILLFKKTLWVSAHGNSIIAFQWLDIVIQLICSQTILCGYR